MPLEPWQLDRISKQAREAAPGLIASLERTRWVTIPVLGFGEAHEVFKAALAAAGVPIERITFQQLTPPATSNVDWVLDMREERDELRAEVARLRSEAKDAERVIAQLVLKAGGDVLIEDTLHDYEIATMRELNGIRVRARPVR